jgi:hypothetical protein
MIFSRLKVKLNAIATPGGRGVKSIRKEEFTLAGQLDFSFAMVEW